MEDLGRACAKLEEDIRSLRRRVDRFTAKLHVEQKIVPRTRGARGLWPGLLLGFLLVLALAFGLFVFVLSLGGTGRG